MKQNENNKYNVESLKKMIKDLKHENSKLRNEFQKQADLAIPDQKLEDIQNQLNVKIKVPYKVERGNSLKLRGLINAKKEIEVDICRLKGLNVCQNMQAVVHHNIPIVLLISSLAVNLFLFMFVVS